VAGATPCPVGTVTDSDITGVAKDNAIAGVAKENAITQIIRKAIILFFTYITSLF